MIGSRVGVVQIAFELLKAPSDNASELHKKEPWPRLRLDHQQPVLIPDNPVAKLNSESSENVRLVLNYQVIPWCYSIVGAEIGSDM